MNNNVTTNDRKNIITSATYANSLPVQRLPLADKKKPEFFTTTYDYFIRQAQNLADKDEVYALQNAANGVIDDETYHYVLNPFNTDVDKLKSFPGALRNYDIISPIVNAFMGEFINSVKDFQVVCVNPDSVNKMKEELKLQCSKIMAQRFVNNLNELGFDTGVKTEDVPDTKKFAEDFVANYNEQRANFGQDALEYILAFNKSEYQAINAFYDWIVTGQVYTYKYIQNGEVYREIINPYEAYPIDNGEPFVEDHDAFVRIYRMSIGKIIDRFRDKLSEEDREYIQKIANDYTNGTSPVSIPMTMVSSRSLTKEARWDFITSSVSNNSATLFCRDPRMVMVYHVIWKTERKVGILTYLDGFGRPQETEVSEDYKLDEANGDVTIKWDWINEVWEGWRIGERYAGIYLEARPIEVQRNLLTNVSKCKLNVNGKRGLVKGSGNFSIVKILLPYQAVYNIFHLQRERAIAKNKGNIITLPKGALANDDEVSQEEAMYYITADGLMLLDETSPNFSLAVQGIKTVNASDSEFILGMGKLIQEVKMEAWDAIGMSRQRLGDAYASDGKAVTEQAIFRSSIISVPIFHIFNLFTETDYNGLVDYSKFAFIDGKKGSYVNSDGRQIFFEINGVDHCETDYGIFVKNSIKEHEKLAKLKEIAFSAGQNGDWNIAMEALDANSVSKVRSVIARFQDLKDKQTQANAENEQKLKEEIEANTERRHQEELNNNLTIAREKNQTAKELKEMDADIAIIALQNSGSNEGTDNSKTEANTIKREQLAAMERIKNRELAFNNMIEDKKNKIKEKQIASQEKIASVNRNKYSK